MASKHREHDRLKEAHNGVRWRQWGPYLSERQWGTVREDQSPDGDAWNSFTHDQARSRVYRWGEDGIAGFCDDGVNLCLALGLWNHRDAILKERLFGLTNAEGNHGEDVKEYYFYVDATPTHSYNRMLYKYPQAAFPYETLVRMNRERGRNDLEFELLDTGIFAEDRYFDVEVEYAKDAPDEILMQITVTNRGPDRAALEMLPHLWYRNTWSRDGGTPRPTLEEVAGPNGFNIIYARHPGLGEYYLIAEGAHELLFTNNETNEERLLGRPNPARYVKDGINDYIVQGRYDAVNPEQSGTKAAVRYELDLDAGERAVLRLCLGPARSGERFKTFDEIISSRRDEADEFYASLTPPGLSEDDVAIMRQGFAGALWGKQGYVYDGRLWLADHGASLLGKDGHVRNHAWPHMQAADIISMPDKWEYPWFAAWDLAFHAVQLAFVDPDFAMSQLDLMLRDRYVHPNGQIPAYEWNFSDVNPPVHAWAAMFTYRLLKRRIGNDRALEFLRTVFHGLMLNYTWWLNRKDRNGANLFEGGFLGLDNIGVFDRSSPLPGGGYLEQADGTAWMALFSQNMLEMAIELARHDRIYEEMAIKYYEQSILVAAAMDVAGNTDSEMWDEEDGFFYDVLRMPDGRATRLKVRSMVGLIPLCAVTVYTPDVVTRLPRFMEAGREFSKARPELFERIFSPGVPGVRNRRMLAVVDEGKLRRVLRRMLDPEEFLSDHGIRALSRHHRDSPYVFYDGPREHAVRYVPGDSDSGMFGGNSNWRGPVWIPVNVLLIRAMLHLYTYFGNRFTVECPTGSGRQMTLFEVARDLSDRVTSIFRRDQTGRRPVYGGTRTFQEDPHWRDHILFYEYFHGDNGAGIGASHQTGWTGMVSALIALFGALSPEQALQDVGSVFDILAASGTLAETGVDGHTWKAALH